MKNIYHLYLDESETHSEDNQGRWINQVFCISGIITTKNFHDVYITPEINRIKSAIWHDLPNNADIILHEKDIRFSQNPFNKFKLNKVSSEYHRFNRDINCSIKLFNGLEKIIRQKDVKIIGGCVIWDELTKNYHEDILNNKSLIALQLIMENFSHFLQSNNGVGRVFYESVGNEPDKQMSLRFHQIKAMGTMYVSPYAMQSLILDIQFPKKSDNIAGLQVADFIPNDIARDIAGKKSHRFNLNKVVKRSQYDGGLTRSDKFGVKIIPRIT